MEIIPFGKATCDLVFRKLGQQAGNRNTADFWVNTDPIIIIGSVFTGVTV